MEQVWYIYGVTDKSFIPQFEKLGKEYYPDTVYGQYARFYSTYNKFINPNFGRNANKYEVAAPLFAELASLRPTFPLADECMLYQAECYLFTDRGDEAIGILEDLKRKFPNSPVVQGAQKVIEKLRRVR